jgi:hypothetical protein
VDILASLKDRTTFIRDFYNTTSSPFRETMRKIEAGEAPFEPHLAKYEDEPPFTTEWIDANTSLEVLGRVCMSMLSAALKLYFNTWRAHLCIELQPSEKTLFNKHGFLNGYKQLLGERLSIEWSECPTDLGVIEQVILARIRDQHPDSITRQSVTHRREDLRRDPVVPALRIWSGRYRMAPSSITYGMSATDTLSILPPTLSAASNRAIDFVLYAGSDNNRQAK